MSASPGSPRPTVVLFTRDLRVTDNPVLATSADRPIIPLFVHEPGTPISALRRRFLRESLADLRESLLARNGDLFEAHGDPVETTMRVATETGADRITVASDAGIDAVRRQFGLVEACRTARIELVALSGVPAVPAGALHPVQSDHYRVFTPYWRVWRDLPLRSPVPTPGRLDLPAELPAWLVAERRPATAGTGDGFPTSQYRGGERAGSERLASWLLDHGDGRRSGGCIAHYAKDRDFLAVDGTSHLGPYLHLGCVSPVEVVRQVARRAGDGAEAFLRQLCWRDFFHQVLHAFPQLPRAPYRSSAADEGARDDAVLAAWRDGQTGVPLVDAGMRQLAAEGWLHNRARMVVASYLTRDLGQDWRPGADHFMAHLIDADVANNYGGWQWVAGTGNNPRPGRRLSPTRQAVRFDPDGEYQRRYLQLSS